MKRNVNALLVIVLLAMALIPLTGCQTNAGTYSIVGGAGGAGAGALIGALTGDSHDRGKRAAIGAAIGLVGGAVGGGLVGHYVDVRQALNQARAQAAQGRVSEEIPYTAEPMEARRYSLPERGIMQSRPTRQTRPSARYQSGLMEVETTVRDENGNVLSTQSQWIDRATGQPVDVERY